jgi:hypothetical protein
MLVYHVGKFQGYLEMLARPKWILIKLMVQGRFVLKKMLCFIFWDGLSVPENGDVLSQFWSGMLCPRIVLSQGPFCPRDFSLQHFWDEKPLGRFVRGRFVRVPNFM